MSLKQLIENSRKSPDEIYGELFREVQLKRIFSDTKTFVDCVPKISSEEILRIYNEKKSLSNFNLSKFIEENFNFPHSPAKNFSSERNLSTVDHINRLWEILSRPADEIVEGSSRIALPYSYVVPGGRFREIFYWDSYFTMLGLSVSSKYSFLIENIINNFVYLIDQYDFIPNGNRTYFLTRSQPPFFACMIQLLSQIHSNPSEIRKKYLPYLHKEYLFWMNGKDQVNENEIFNQHVVWICEDVILNRYFDPLTNPRPESYPKEEEERKKAEELFGISSEEFYLHNRAACESGWDFSSRWFDDKKTKELNKCAFILPIDLNCLIYSLENYLSFIYNEQNNDELSQQFQQLAKKRKEIIQTLFWSNEKKFFFFDYDPIRKCLKEVFSLAAVYPLFFQIATKEQADYVRQHLEKDFLKSGGLLTTLECTGQQWDSPIGWAPLQWISYQAMKNYQFQHLANEIRSRWLKLNDEVFKQTGKMTEKYNVLEQKEGGGGNYPLQDGFGWTNGVYLRLFFD
ncbi:unnamed protein product [Adineta ricciae]|uniref:Trehalase n=1 Tax=Adineta ricciae TaxID=249248 RepID=A0A815XVA5_ADIRI|nr:unnamed protein product [Adineta ricciae]CAF1562031.1 unnamed protein product [Adineta ricciae]